MSLPKAAFLDTSVFAGQQYNFCSAALSAFVPVARDVGLDVLLPDPTEREINRQIRERSQEALKALEEARRRAPFLSKWKHFPPERGKFAEWDVGRVANRELHDFFSKLKLKRLDYKGVSLDRVMSWYDTVRAPFGDGKKRKEFPDAFAIDIVATYAEAERICVAVVSSDGDMKGACEYYSSLLFFPALSKLTELLVLKDSDLLALKDTVNESSGPLEGEVSASVNALDFYTYDERYEIDEHLISPVVLTDLSIVGVGHDECTVEFFGEFDSEHRFIWEEVVNSDGETQQFSDWITQSNMISGIAKLSLHPSTRQVIEVLSLQLSETEFEIRRTPNW